MDRLHALQREVVTCVRCPRLVAWRERVALDKVARFRQSKYWGKPVPGFGDHRARLLVVGLAPAAHGGNRTGRMFTGDRSGDWLYRALYRAGFASRAESVSHNDGLKLLDCYVTASARCAPPQNKLLPGELLNCRPYIVQEIRLLIQVRVVVALGKVASDAVYNCFREIGKTALSTRPKFAHGMECRLNERQMLLASYHPSQQNTFTGKLTEKMLDAVFTRARRLLQQS